MIKYVGNYAEWIKDEWIEYLTNTCTGTFFPIDATPITEPMLLHNFDGITPAGDPLPGYEQLWSKTEVCCITYKQPILPFEVNLPFEVDGKYDWFFLKLPPGMSQPVHTDSSIEEKLWDGGVALPNPKVLRYWMPLQDHKRGHIFLYDDVNFTDYKKGDLFLHDGECVWHGGGNMGHAIRLTWNLEVYPTELQDTPK